jgi:protein-disulfide isomerase
MNPSERTTRRSLLTVTGAGIAALAGCFTVSQEESEATSGDGASGQATTATDEATTPAGDSTASGTETSTADSLATPVAGDPDAAVTVAVYEDFACPHCRTFNEDVYPQLQSAYVEPETIRYEHHDLPIPVDETASWQAPSAARAVQSIAGDDAFYEYVHLLFANQRSLGPDTYASLAGEVGADGETVRSAAVNRRYDETVRADRQAGIDRGVEGTPTAFVNDEQVDATYEALSDAIDAAQSDST